MKKVRIETIDEHDWLVCTYRDGPTGEELEVLIPTKCRFMELGFVRNDNKQFLVNQGWVDLLLKGETVHHKGLTIEPQFVE